MYMAGSKTPTASDVAAISTSMSTATTHLGSDDGGSSITSTRDASLGSTQGLHSFEQESVDRVQHNDVERLADDTRAHASNCDVASGTEMAPTETTHPLQLVSDLLGAAGVSKGFGTNQNGATGESEAIPPGTNEDDDLSVDSEATVPTGTPNADARQSESSLEVAGKGQQSIACSRTAPPKSKVGGVTALDLNSLPQARSVTTGYASRRSTALIPLQ